MKPRARIGSVLLLLACVACCRPAEEPDTLADPHSFARPDEVVVEHLKLDVVVDFESRRIEGRASLAIRNRRGAGQLWLDTRDLDIRGVRLDDSGEPAEFRLGEGSPLLGRPLVVTIGPRTRTVHIDYASNPEAMALQWLEPAQTTGGQHPFLLSQSQAILARTWIPCQDSPAVRMTYEATVRVPPGLIALMSAENPTETRPDGIYSFDMPQRVPAYLLALAVGDLEYRSLGPRSGVYAEPQVIERAAYEFGETEQMIDAAEKLYGNYRWGVYDMVVLPASFPFGGMENPRLTFVTPTVLAGDRSLVSLVAHELAHSWSGNLVTNATWNDFWLNEGFTVYLEMRIMEELNGRDYSEMLSFLGRKSLERDLTDLGPESPDTHLRLDLAGRDPDDGMTEIAYEKGYAFLRMLEQEFGRQRWDRFLREYFERFAFQSMTTRGFVSHLRAELIEGSGVLEDRLRIDDWVYGPGLPSNAPIIESAAFLEVNRQLARWVEGAPAKTLSTSAWSTHEWLHFVRGLPASLPAGRMAELDLAFRFSGTGNSEVLHVWLLQAIAQGYEPAYGALEAFLTGMGRRKFLEPLYTAMAKTPEGLVRARRIYGAARAGYHPLARGTVDRLLGWPWDSGPAGGTR